MGIGKSRLNLFNESQENHVLNLKLFFQMKSELVTVALR